MIIITYIIIYFNFGIINGIENYYNNFKILSDIHNDLESIVCNFTTDLNKYIKSINRKKILNENEIIKILYDKKISHINEIMEKDYKKFENNDIVLNNIYDFFNKISEKIIYTDYFNLFLVKYDNIINVCYNSDYLKNNIIQKNAIEKLFKENKKYTNIYFYIFRKTISESYYIYINAYSGEILNYD